MKGWKERAGVVMDGWEQQALQKSFIHPSLGLVHEDAVQIGIDPGIGRRRGGEGKGCEG